MSAEVDFSSMRASRLFGRFALIRAGALQKELVANLHEAAPQILADMHAKTHTKIQRRAMKSVRADRLVDGLRIEGGVGGGLPQELFPGGEFGGQRGTSFANKKRDMFVPVFGGPRQFIKRRATLQFLPHLGPEGYFFYPTWFEWEEKLIDQSERIVADALGGR